MPLGFRTPEQGAATAIHLASSPAVEGVSGRYFVDFRRSPRLTHRPMLLERTTRITLDPEQPPRWIDSLLVRRHAHLPVQVVPR